MWLQSRAVAAAHGVVVVARAVVAEADVPRRRQIQLTHRKVVVNTT